MSYVSILGVKIDRLTKEEVLEKIEQLLLSSRQSYVVTCNPEFLVKAREDVEFFNILNKADLAVADGVGLVLASYLFNQPLPQRISGVDLMEDICALSSQKGYQVFLYGAGQGIAHRAAQKLANKYFGLKINVIEKDKILIAEESKRPAILFVALGAPKQEKWIANNLKYLPKIKLAMGVGGAFDLISGEIKRAPVIFQKVGLEWLWRLIIQPQRFKRIIKAVIVFPYLVLKQKIYGQ